MNDQINEGLCRMLQRLMAIDIDDEYFAEESEEDLKPHTVDGVPIRKLFVGNLSQRTTHKDLEKLFSTYGKLDSCYLKKNTGKSNYAFVTFHDVEDALKATKEGHKKNIHIHNRDLRVMPADSWHQPDSIENQKKKKVQKSAESNQETIEFDLNEDSEIHKLNDDCLLHIFSFLPIVDRIRMEIVCRRWQLISQESWRTFKKIDLKPATWNFSKTENADLREIDTPTLRKVLLHCGIFIAHIDISSYADKLSKSTLTVIGRLCPNLQTINVTALNVSSAGIKTLAENCSNISKVSLGHSNSAIDNDLSHLFTKNKKIRYLELIRTGITGKCLMNLPKESVETIILNECTNLSALHFSNAIKTFNKLHTLSLSNSVNFNDEALKAISMCAQNLKELHFCDFHPLLRIKDTLVIANLVNLQLLNVSDNVLVQNELLKEIATQCKQLTDVDISSCHAVTNEGVACLALLPKLENLSINYLNKVTDDVLSDIPNLRKLECRGCWKLKNQGLSNLIKEADNLQLLDFSNCTGLTNELVEVAIDATMNRSNSQVLNMYVGGSNIVASEINRVSPLLQILNVDLSEAHLHPEFDDDYFPDEFDDIYDHLDIDDSDDMMDDDWMNDYYWHYIRNEEDDGDDDDDNEDGYNYYYNL